MAKGYGTMKKLGIKLLSILLCAALCAGLLPVGVLAANSGSCGPNLTWSYDTGSRKLTVSGTGAMDDYNDSDPPWYSYADRIRTLVIDSGVTRIGDRAFLFHESLVSVALPDTVTEIGDAAFCCCLSLSVIRLPASALLARAAAFFSMPNARTISRGMVSIPTPIGKFSLLRCVCAPQRRSAGTLTSPIESCSIRYSIHSPPHRMTSNTCLYPLQPDAFDGVFYPEAEAV